MTPLGGSRTSPFPVNSKILSLSATNRTASSFLKYLSVLHSLANSTQDLVSYSVYSALCIVVR